MDVPKVQFQSLYTPSTERAKERIKKEESQTVSEAAAVFHIEDEGKRRQPQQEEAKKEAKEDQASEEQSEDKADQVKKPSLNITV